MSQLAGNFDDFGMDTITLAGVTFDGKSNCRSSCRSVAPSSTITKYHGPGSYVRRLSIRSAVRASSFASGPTASATANLGAVCAVESFKASGSPLVGLSAWHGRN